MTQLRFGPWLNFSSTQNVPGPGLFQSVLLILILGFLDKCTDSSNMQEVPGLSLNWSTRHP